MARCVTLAVLMVLVAGTATPSFGYVHPALGRFMERDPIAIRDLLSPNDFNHSTVSVVSVAVADEANSYLLNSLNPLRLTDPDGFQSTQPATGPASCCGPAIDAQLQFIRNSFRSQFTALDKGRKYKEKYRLLQFLINFQTAPEGWDVSQLRQGSAGSKTCGTGSGPCRGSVTVGGTCWPQGVVNYWLAGAILYPR